MPTAQVSSGCWPLRGPQGAASCCPPRAAGLSSPGDLRIGPACPCQWERRRDPQEGHWSPPAPRVAGPHLGTPASGMRMVGLKCEAWEASAAGSSAAPLWQEVGPRRARNLVLLTCTMPGDKCGGVRVGGRHAHSPERLPCKTAVAPQPDTGAGPPPCLQGDFTGGLGAELGGWVAGAGAAGEMAEARSCRPMEEGLSGPAG